MFFKEESLKIITAASPESALKIISSTELNLIVTDIKMPGMHGLEMIEEIRKKNPDLPIIIFTAFKGMKEDYIVRLYNIKEYYIKPVDWNRLFKRIKQLSSPAKKTVRRREKT